MIDDFHLRGSSRCRRMGETATAWRCSPSRFTFSIAPTPFSQRAPPRRCGPGCGGKPALDAGWHGFPKSAAATRRTALSHSDPSREGHRALPRSGPINRSIRPSTPAVQVAAPVIHEPAATLEQIRTPVDCLDLVAGLVRQGSLRHFARMIGLLRRPVSKARPEAARHGRDLQLPEQFRNRRVPERLPPKARKHKRTARPSARASSRISKARRHSNTTA